MKVISCIFALFFLCGCHQNQSGNLANIFGNDERRILEQKQYPWSSIGRFDKSGCTGTLVAKNIVVTAAHCFTSNNIQPFDDNFTIISTIEGRVSSSITKFWFGSFQPKINRNNDWALIQLSEPLGLHFGWLGTDNMRPKKGLPVSMAGFSNDRAEGTRLSGVKNCHIRGYKKNLLLHDCDATRGSSGAALFSWYGNNSSGKKLPYIVGINIGEFRRGSNQSLKVNSFNPDVANCAITSDTFLETLSSILKQS